MRGEVRSGRREGVGRWRRKRHARGEGPTQGLEAAQGTRGAHEEHLVHVRDLGGVKAQRLVEGRRVLPSRREGMRCGGERCEPGGGRAWGVVAARQAACTGERPDSRLGGQGHARRAHVEHEAHGRDAGSVKTQRLVEGARVLPSRREGHMRCGARCAPGGGRVWGGGGASGLHGEGPTRGCWGPGHARSAPGTCPAWS